MTDGRVSQGVVRSFNEPAPDDRISQLSVRSVFNYPADGSRVSQGVVRSFNEPAPLNRTSQLLVRAIVRGRVEDPIVKAWTYSLDGHDYYVLNLGTDHTFVYDKYAQQWVEWLSPGRSNWRAIRGINWNGGSRHEPLYGSNVLVGDDSWGLVWFLNPTQPYDENPDFAHEDQTLYFERVAMGQLAVSGRLSVPCYAVFVTTDDGDPAYDGAGVTLLTSDDGGHSFNDHGTIEIVADEFAPPKLTWYSLGQINDPGRLFKLVDDGAVARIDQMDMNDDDG